MQLQTCCTVDLKGASLVASKRTYLVRRVQRVAVVVAVSAVGRGPAVAAVEGEAVVVEGLVVGKVGVALVVREVPVDVDVLEDALLAVDCVH